MEGVVMRGYEATVTQWFCVDCTMAAANGEFGPDRPGDLPEPLSAVPEGWLITMGRAFEEHSCGREDGEDVVECDCEDGGFMAAGCDGCADGLAGDKHAFTLWIPQGV